MHPHLELVIASQAKSDSLHKSSDFSEMAIIVTQGQLMAAGSMVFKAIKSGEIAHILLGLVALAYEAVQPLAQQGKDIAPKPESFPQTYQMLPIMRLLSSQVNACSSGDMADYSMLYYVCSHLSTDFLNADFDKAFRVYDLWYKAYWTVDAASLSLIAIEKSKWPDLTDCLFE